MAKIDILGREKFVDRLVALTENISENKASASFAINGVWGCGKSFVLDMYEERLNQIQSEETATDNYFVIRYNCWKYDYYEEPLVAIVAAMIDIVNQKTKLWNDERKKARFLSVLKVIGGIFLSAASAEIKAKTGVDLKDALKAFATSKKGVQAGEKKIEKTHQYDSYFLFNQALKHLQDLIKELSQTQTVIFLVDELDRCLPEYAIKVLERLHHLTENLENVITVLSMDKNQLETSIKQIFGFEKPEEYLKKFVQFEIELDIGTVSDRFSEKHADYVALFEDRLCPVEDSIEEFVQLIFRGLDVRRQEQLVQRAFLFHRQLFHDPKSKVFMCMELLIVTIFSCYNKNTLFCNFVENVVEISSKAPEDSAAPPFSWLFDERFKKATQKHNTRTYLCLNSKALYGYILYLWCNLFFKDQWPDIRINNNLHPNRIEDELDDLRKFLGMVEFVK